MNQDLNYQNYLAYFKTPQTTTDEAETQTSSSNRQKDQIDLFTKHLIDELRYRNKKPRAWIIRYVKEQGR